MDRFILVPGMMPEAAAGKNSIIAFKTSKISIDQQAWTQHAGMALQ